MGGRTETQVGAVRAGRTRGAWIDQGPAPWTVACQRMSDFRPPWRETIDRLRSPVPAPLMLPRPPRLHLVVRRPNCGAPLPGPDPDPVAPVDTAATEALGHLGAWIAGSRHPHPGQIESICHWVQRAGGYRLPPGLFSAILLDVTDRMGRVPPATWLALARGLALGAALPAAGGLPLPLEHAAQRVLAHRPLPPARQRALRQALGLRAQ